MYAWAVEALPGLLSLRGPSKFLVPAALFGSLLAAMGCEALLERPRAAGAMAAGLVVVLVLLVAGAAWLWKVEVAAEGPSPLKGLLDSRVDRGEAFFMDDPPETYYDQAARFGVQSLLIGAATCGAAAALIWLRRHRRWAAYALVVFGIAEVLVFARLYRGTFELSLHERPRVRHTPVHGERGQTPCVGHRGRGQREA